MILKNPIITDLKVESIYDLYKLKPFLEDRTLKINKSQVARELDMDRRTVDKYINGYEKNSTRSCNNCIPPYWSPATLSKYPASMTCSMVDELMMCPATCCLRIYMTVLKILQ